MSNDLSEVLKEEKIGAKNEQNKVEHFRLFIRKKSIRFVNSRVLIIS